MVRSHAHAVGEEAVGHLQRLLRFDTTNPPGNETVAAEYLARVLGAEGYEPEVLESAPGRGNLVIRFPGSGEKAPLLLYGHLDVVPAETSYWTHDPFSGHLSAGCLWGRGSLDMKYLVVQQLMVMLLLRRTATVSRRDVIFAASADEEAGGAAGMGFLVRHHPDLVSAEYALSEGGGMAMYMAGQEIYDIRTAEKGTCRLRIQAKGIPGHGSLPRRETSVTRIAAAVSKLASTSLSFRATPTVERYFMRLAEILRLPPDEHRLTPTNLQRMVDILPVELGLYLHAITHDTAVPTGLAAGRKINVVPSEAEMLVDGRYLPGRSVEEFVRGVTDVIGRGYEVEILDSSSPLESPPGDPLYETIASVIRESLPRAGVVPSMLSGATDAKHVSLLGTHCLGFGPIRVPQSFPVERLVHGHDERIPIQGYLWGLEVLWEVVQRFCL